MFNAVFISLGSCAVIEVAWHLLTRRSHRGGHARADIMYSPYTLAARVAREWAQDDDQLRHTGMHHALSGESALAVEMLSGELPLLSGYANDRSHGVLPIRRYASPHNRSASWRR